MDNLESIVRTAWNTTRREHQPEYDALEGSYQSYLCKRAEPVLATSYPTGDGALADFDHWLSDYHRRQEEAKARGEKVDKRSN